MRKVRPVGDALVATMTRHFSVEVTPRAVACPSDDLIVAAPPVAEPTARLCGDREPFDDAWARSSVRYVLLLRLHCCCACRRRRGAAALTAGVRPIPTVRPIDMNAATHADDRPSCDDCRFLRFRSYDFRADAGNPGARQPAFVGFDGRRCPLPTHRPT